MLNIKTIEKNPNYIIECLEKRYFEGAKEKVDNLIRLERERKKLQASKDKLQNEINNISKRIGQLIKQKKIEEASNSKEKIFDLKKNSTSLQKEVEKLKTNIKDILVAIPNIVDISVPIGKGEADNEIIYESKNFRQANPKTANNHWDICKKQDIIDFNLGSKISSSGFLVYKSKGADLQRALINFFLDENKSQGYEHLMIPSLVNEESAFCTGQLPDKEGQMYKTEKDDLYLIPTSEVPIMNILRDEIIDYKKLPIKLTAHSHCFRREAGSYGKNVRGLNRLHEFEKVEIVQVTDNKSSYKAIEEMSNHIKNILDKLELKYRILRLCSGDMGWTASLTYDFEVYSPGQDMWLEISSVSNCESYQSNRLKLRYKDEGGNKLLCHSLNGSSLALPRIFAAIIETYENKGNIEVPPVLIKYINREIL